MTTKSSGAIQLLFFDIRIRRTEARMWCSVAPDRVADGRATATVTRRRGVCVQTGHKSQSGQAPCRAATPTKLPLWRHVARRSRQSADDEVSAARRAWKRRSFPVFRNVVRMIREFPLAYGVGTGKSDYNRSSSRCVVVIRQLDTRSHRISEWMNQSCSQSIITAYVAMLLQGLTDCSLKYEAVGATRSGRDNHWNDGVWFFEEPGLTSSILAGSHRIPSLRSTAAGDVLTLLPAA